MCGLSTTCHGLGIAALWDPQVVMGLNTIVWSNDLDELGVPSFLETSIIGIQWYSYMNMDVCVVCNVVSRMIFHTKFLQNLHFDSFINLESESTPLQS